MARTEPGGSGSSGRRGFLANALDRLGPSGRAERDLGALNLLLVLVGALACLTCFLLYLIWKSFTVAAPTVLWSETEVVHDPGLHRYTQGFEPEPHRTPVDPEAEKLLSRLAIVERGSRLYRNTGCGLCHGPDGQGGVTNPNYINDTFPSLDEMASKLSLEFEEDAEVVIDVLGKGVSLTPEIDSPDAALIAAKYEIIRKVVLEGNEAGKKDLEGPEPIFMPSYKDLLTEPEMNELLGCFLILYPLEEEEWEEEE